MQKKILITGGSGLLAINWALSIRKKYEVTLLLHHRKISLQGVNISFTPLYSLDECLDMLDMYQPDVVIHAAALTSVEECESNIDLAQKVNVDMARNIAIACSNKNVKLVHISTDHLFSGSQKLLSEDSTPNPINNYAKTKLQGEYQVIKNCKDALIIRTNFFGWGTKYRQSFSDFILSNLVNKQKINLFSDVFFTPILINELADKVHGLIKEDASGVFNVAGSERLSKYEFGIKLANCFDLDVNLINISSIKDRPDLIRRPEDMSLSNAKICKFLNCKISDIDKQLQVLKHQKIIAPLISCINR